MSLVTKSFFLVVVIILANFGFQKDRPFLLGCVDENSTLLNNMEDVIPCTNLTSCFSERKFSEPRKENFTELSAVLQHLELANSSLEQFEKNGNLAKRALLGCFSFQTAPSCCLQALDVAEQLKVQ